MNIRIPTRAIPLWRHIEVDLKNRITKREFINFDEVPTSAILVELLVLASQHIHCDALAVGQQNTHLLRQNLALARRVEELEKQLGK